MYYLQQALNTPMRTINPLTSVNLEDYLRLSANTYRNKSHLLYDNYTFTINEQLECFYGLINNQTRL